MCLIADGPQPRSSKRPRLVSGDTPIGPWTPAMGNTPTKGFGRSPLLGHVQKPSTHWAGQAVLGAVRQCEFGIQDVANGMAWSFQSEPVRSETPLVHTFSPKIGTSPHPAGFSRARTIRDPSRARPAKGRMPPSPYTCSTCGRQYQHSNHLRRHEAARESRLPGSQPPMNADRGLVTPFTDASAAADLVSHGFKCKYCGRVFKRRFVCL